MDVGKAAALLEADRAGDEVRALLPPAGALDTGVLRVDEWRAGPNQQLEPQMRWLLEASEASGDPELRGLASSLEALLLREFSGEIPELHDTSARHCAPPELC